MKIFWAYYGGKWRCAPHFPSPEEYSTIVEPFAGSAGFSVRRGAGKKVILVDQDPIICNLWKYLISVSEEEILSLPLMGMEDSVEDLKICQEAKWLIGWWCNKGVAFPRLRPSSRMKYWNRPNSHWGPVIRERIANQLKEIRHWEIIEGSYEAAPDIIAYWFVDPPYCTSAGRHYRFHDLDYSKLASWCKERKGQVVVCEQKGADWLPFQHSMKIKNSHLNGKSFSEEVFWVKNEEKPLFWQT